MMKAVKHLLLAFASLVVLGVTATSALAVTLPDVHVALEEAYPITATSKAPKAITGLATAGGSVLTGEGVETTLTWTELSAAGTYVANFTNVVKGAKKCKTTGDAAGTVLISGGVALVTVSEAPLTVAPLFSVPKTKIECEGLNVTVEGNVLGTYTGSLNKQITEFTGTLKGEKGKQELTKYLNDAGETKEALLLSEAGAGFTKSSENVSEVITFKSAKMLEVLG
jgi:hypothetical protein